MASTKKSWLLTLGLDPYEGSPCTVQEAQKQFERYRNYVVKQARGSGSAVDAYKSIGESLEADKDSIIAEATAPSARSHAQDRIIASGAETVALLKTQSLEFNGAMVDIVAKEAKRRLKDAMHPGGLYKLTEEDVERIIVANGGAVVDGSDHAGLYRDLRIEETLRARFRLIDKRLEGLDAEDLYQFVGLASSGEARESSSAVLVERAREIGDSIPRDADSMGVTRATLAKDAMEVFGDASMRADYDKHLVSRTLETSLAMLKDLSDAGQSISKELAELKVRELAEALPLREDAPKYFIGYMSANGVQCDITLTELMRALDPSTVASSAKAAETVEDVPTETPQYAPYSPFAAPVPSSKQQPVPKPTLPKRPVIAEIPRSTVSVPKKGESARRAAAKPDTVSSSNGPSAKSSAPQAASPSSTRTTSSPSASSSTFSTGEKIKDASLTIVKAPFKILGYVLGAMIVIIIIAFIFEILSGLAGCVFTGLFG